MKDSFIACGKIVSTHGVRGELKVQAWTNDITHLLKFSRFYLGDETALEVESSRIHKKMLLLKVKGITDLNMADTYRGKEIFIHREDDPDDTPYLIDYMGIEVTDVDTGTYYGKVIDILETGANDVFHLEDDKGVQRLVPDIPQVIITFDMDNKKMEIRPLEGLFDS